MTGLGQSAHSAEVETVGQMRMDLIDLSHRLPKGDAELPRLWNAAFDALVALQKRLEVVRDA